MFFYISNKKKNARKWKQESKTWRFGKVSTYFYSQGKLNILQHWKPKGKEWTWTKISGIVW